MSWRPLWPEEGKAGTAFSVRDGQKLWIWGRLALPEVTRAIYDADRQHFVTKSGKRVPEHEITHWRDRPADQRPGPPKLDFAG